MLTVIENKDSDITFFKWPVEPNFYSECVYYNKIYFRTGKGFKPKAGLDSLPGSDDDRETADNWSTASVLSDEGVSSIPSEDGTYLKTPPHPSRPHPSHTPYPHDCIFWLWLYCLRTYRRSPHVFIEPLWIIDIFQT